METIASLYNFITDKTVSVPLGELIIFITFISFFLLYGNHKMGLLVTFCFVLYWGFIINFNYFVSILGETSIGLPIYLLSGISMVILIILGFFLESRE